MDLLILATQKNPEKNLEIAINLLEICKQYIDRHYKNAVFGEYQKNLLDMIDEFLAELKK